MSCGYVLDYFGCNVTFIERHSAVAQETSFQNGGLLCPSQSDSWTYWKNITWSKLSNIRLGPHLVRHYRWFSSWLGSTYCSTDLQIRQLSELSMVSMHAPPFDSILKSYGCHATGTYDVLSHKTYSDDKNGDVKSFSDAIFKRLSTRCIFRFQTTVTGFQREGNKITGLQVRDVSPDSENSESIIHADAFVLATGNGTQSLLSRLGLYVPILPVLGYLRTFTVTHQQKYPQKKNLKFQNYFVSPLSSLKYRASAFADIGFTQTQLSREQDLCDLVSRDFPAHKLVSTYHGFRPLSPDDLPYIGRAKPFQNLFVCAGHGSKGWTQAAGSAVLLKQIIFGEHPVIRTEPFEPNRFE